jgi:hypothetical protein
MLVALIPLADTTVVSMCFPTGSISQAEVTAPSVVVKVNRLA